jgi:hypothetical protein
MMRVSELSPDKHRYHSFDCPRGPSARLAIVT